MMFFESIGCIRDRLEPFIHPKDKNEEYLDAENYYGLYFDIARKVQPRSILEIGVRFGYSAIAMLFGCNGDADFIGIDNESYEIGSNQHAEDQIRRVCYRDVHVIKVDTQELISLPPEVWTHFFGIIHVDGDHKPSGLIHDLNLVSPLARFGTWIIVDDTEHPAHMELKEVCRSWANENRFDYVELDSYRGMTAMRRSNG